MRNNYNTSSSGIDIEASIFLDGEMSSINFNENMEKMDSYFGDIWIYTNFGNLEYHIKNKSGSRYVKGLPLSNIINYPDLFEIDWSTVSKKTMGQWLLNNYRNDLRMTKEYMEDYVYDVLRDDYGELKYFEEQLDKLKVSYRKKFEIISTTGYSQGDYAEVIILLDDLREIWGYKGTDEELVESIKTDIDHYFWDSPMCVRITVNGEDYYSEKFDGMYEKWGELEYNKEEVVEEFVEMVMNDQKDLDREVLRRELEEVIPETIEYSY